MPTLFSRRPPPSKSQSQRWSTGESIRPESTSVRLPLPTSRYLRSGEFLVVGTFIVSLSAYGAALLQQNVRETIMKIFKDESDHFFRLILPDIQSFSSLVILLPLIPLGFSLVHLRHRSPDEPLVRFWITILKTTFRATSKSTGVCIEAALFIAIRLLPVLGLFVVLGFFSDSAGYKWMYVTSIVVLLCVIKVLYRRFFSALLAPIVAAHAPLSFRAAREHALPLTYNKQSLMLVAFLLLWGAEVYALSSLTPDIGTNVALHALWGAIGCTLPAYALSLLVGIFERLRERDSLP